MSRTSDEAELDMVVHLVTVHFRKCHSMVSFHTLDDIVEASVPSVVLPMREGGSWQVSLPKIILCFSHEHAHWYSKPNHVQHVCHLLHDARCVLLDLYLHISNTVILLYTTPGVTCLRRGGHLEAMLGHFGNCWEPLGVLRPTWSDLEASWGPLDARCTGTLGLYRYPRDPEPPRENPRGFPL